MPFADALQLTLLLAAPAVLAVLWRRDVLRPGSFARLAARGGGRKIDGLPPGVWFLGALVMLLAMAPGFSVAMALPRGVLGGPESQERQAAGLVLGYTGAVVIATAMLALLRHRAGPRAGLRERWGDVPRGAGRLLVALPLYAATAAAAIWATQAISGHMPPRVAHETLKPLAEGQATFWDWCKLGAAVLGAPVVEELVFRVFLQSTFISLAWALAGGSGARQGAWTWSAILLSSAVFVLFHLPGGAVAVHALPGLFVVGACFGVAYERTGRLGVPIVMHMLFNAGNVALALAEG